MEASCTAIASRFGRSAAINAVRLPHKSPLNAMSVLFMYPIHEGGVKPANSW